jgi:hypothetical protein
MSENKYTREEQEKMLEDGAPLSEIFREYKPTLAQSMDEYYGEGAWRKSA